MCEEYQGSVDTVPIICHHLASLEAIEYPNLIASGMYVSHQVSRQTDDGSRLRVVKRGPPTSAGNTRRNHEFSTKHCMRQYYLHK